MHDCTTSDHDQERDPDPDIDSSELVDQESAVGSSTNFSPLEKELIRNISDAYIPDSQYHNKKYWKDELHEKYKSVKPDMYEFIMSYAESLAMLEHAKARFKQFNVPSTTTLNSKVEDFPLSTNTYTTSAGAAAAAHEDDSHMIMLQRDHDRTRQDHATNSISRSQSSYVRTQATRLTHNGVKRKRAALYQTIPSEGMAHIKLHVIEWEVFDTFREFAATHPEYFTMNPSVQAAGQPYASSSRTSAGLGGGHGRSLTTSTRFENRSLACIGITDRRLADHQFRLRRTEQRLKLLDKINRILTPTITRADSTHCTAHASSMSTNQIESMSTVTSFTGADSAPNSASVSDTDDVKVESIADSEKDFVHASNHHDSKSDSSQDKLLHNIGHPITYGRLVKTIYNMTQHEKQKRLVNTTTDMKMNTVATCTH